MLHNNILVSLRAYFGASKQLKSGVALLSLSLSVLYVIVFVGIISVLFHAAQFIEMLFSRKSFHVFGERVK